MGKIFDPLKLIRQFNKNNIKYILIGRQSVVQYGAPLFSFDYDFWVHPEDRGKTFEITESFGLSSGLEDKPRAKKPIVTFDDDEGNKVDVFFARVLAGKNKDISLSFDEVFKRSGVKKDPKSDFYVRIPDIDDLILLKQLGDMAAKDYEDVEYLESIKKKLRKQK